MRLKGDNDKGYYQSQMQTDEMGRCHNIFYLQNTKIQIQKT